MRLVDVEPLFERAVELEAVALEQVAKYGPLSDVHPGEWHRWDAILTERTAFKYDLMDAPRVDAVPVVRCKDCKHRDPEDHKCDCGALERAGCMFPVADDYFCSCGERRENAH